MKHYIKAYAEGLLKTLAKDGWDETAIDDLYRALTDYYRIDQIGADGKALVPVPPKRKEVRCKYSKRQYSMTYEQRKDYVDFICESFLEGAKAGQTTFRFSDADLGSPQGFVRNLFKNWNHSPITSGRFPNMYTTFKTMNDGVIEVTIHKKNE